MAYMKDKTPKSAKEKTSKPYPAEKGYDCAFGDTIDPGEMMVHNPDDPSEVAHLQCAIDEVRFEIGS